MRRDQHQLLLSSVFLLSSLSSVRSKPKTTLPVIHDRAARLASAPAPPSSVARARQITSPFGQSPITY